MISFLLSQNLDGGGVEVRIGEVLDAGPEPPHGGGIGNIRGLRRSIREATDTTKFVDDNRTRVTAV